MEDHVNEVIPIIVEAINEGPIAQEDQPGGLESSGGAVNQPIEQAEEVVTGIVRREIVGRGSAGAQITNNLLIFSTRKQKTWLSFTGVGVVCVLDNRPKGGQIRAQRSSP